jgi:alkylhydroperoxidase family enzyme
VLGLADAFLRDPHGLSEEARAALLAHYTPDQIVELAMGLAMFMGTSKIAIALGNEPVDMPVTELPTPDRPTVA